MMNVSNLIPLTLFTLTARAFYRFSARLTPAFAIASWWAASPARMLVSTDIFRLPFSHTDVVTEDSFGVEVAGRSGYITATPVALTGNAITATWVWLPILRIKTALQRAKLTLAITNAKRLTALLTRQYSRFTPAIQAITLWRAESLIRATILRAVVTPAVFALSRFFTSHGLILPRIEIEEKYVEIAVQRLQQSVLPLEVTS